MWAETAAKIGVASFDLLLFVVFLLFVLDDGLIIGLGVKPKYINYIGMTIEPGLLLSVPLRIYVRQRMRRNLKQASDSAVADCCELCFF